MTSKVGAGRRHSKQFVAAAALLGVVALAAAPTGAAGKASVGQLRLVSGRSPLAANCGVAGSPQHNLEAEPSLAVDPRHPKRFVAAWMQDPVGEVAVANVAARSQDGGKSWHKVRVPGVSACAGGHYANAADPWLSFGTDGNAYLSTLPLGDQGAGVPAVIVNRSTDEGGSWSGATYVHRQPSAPDGVFDDEESVSADPFHADVAYYTWARPSTPTGVPFPPFNLDISRSKDGGRTWRAPIQIYAPSAGQRVINSQVIVTGPERIVVLFSVLDVTVSGPPRIAFLASSSQDNGRTWSRATEIGETSRILLTDPEQGTEILPSPSIFSGASAPGRSADKAYVAWQDPSSTDASRILLSSSKNGRQWSNSRLVSRGATSPFMPTLAVTRDGTIGVTFFDMRNDRPGDGALTTNAWFRYSKDQGRTWHEARVGGSFDLRSAIDGGAPPELFLGDYQSLVAIGDGFDALLARGQPAASIGPTDVFFAHIGLNGSG